MTNDPRGDARATDAGSTDPLARGWMQGSPPAPERLIRYADGSFFRFPEWRWSFSHWRELVPTVNVARGSGPVRELPRAERADLDAVPFTPLGGIQPLSWAEGLDANFTDGIVVLHRGRIVYEKYFGALGPEREHIAFSVSKSFIGLIAATLVHEGALDAAASVAHYLPELRVSGFGAASVAQVLDMTTALRHSERYHDYASDFASYAYAAGFYPPPRGYAGPDNIYAFLATIAPEGAHGEAFGYRSVNTEVLGWLITRVTGAPVAEVLAARLWRRLGVEADAYLQVDALGTAAVAASLNTRLRDLARFGELLRQDGSCGGAQLVPAAVIADIVNGGSRAAFAKAEYATLPGWSYRHQWWVAHNAHGAYMARGIHGQALYIDPAAEMVIARYASHPLASNINLDPTSLPAYAALAEHLLRHPG